MKGFRERRPLLFLGVGTLFLIAIVSFLLASESIPNDGVADATRAIQRRLDNAGKSGGEVYLPPGRYLVMGSLHVPAGVTLRGSWNGPHDSESWRKGTTLLITGGRGREDGPAAIEMASDTVIGGLTLLWPEQPPDAIVPYPWAIDQQQEGDIDGHHVTVENLTLVNAYQGIRLGRRDAQHHGDLHLLRNIYGCVLRRGISVDDTSDIGRIENVHFNPNAWVRIGSGPLPAERKSNPDVTPYLAENLEAFIFARSDWEYVVNTFVFGARIGYHFVQGEKIACNGQFIGIGADDCRTCVQIDNIQPEGIQITNGEFTAFAGEPNTAVATMRGAEGAVQLVNCNFWGVTGHVVWMRGDTAVTLSGCHIVQNQPRGAILAEQGRLIVQGCTFDQPGPAVLIDKGVKTAVVVGNLQPGGVQIENEIGHSAQIGLNQQQ